MLKRLEVYVDAAVLSFVLSVAVVLVLSALGRLLAMLAGGGQSAMASIMITIVVLSVMIGAGLAIWLARVLHRRAVSQMMDADESRKVAWIALAVAVVAPAIAACYVSFGTTTPVLWLSIAALLMVLAAALVVDALTDLVRVHEHVTMDIIRFVVVGLLAISLATSMIQAAPLGSAQDMSPWVVWVTVAMLVESLLAFGFDEFASWRSRSHSTHMSVTPTG